jgi:hypothetical protein
MSQRIGSSMMRILSAVTALLKDNPQAAVVLVPDAPHTLLNLPAVRLVTAGFLGDIAKR